MKKILFLLAASLLLGTGLSALAIEPPYPEGTRCSVPVWISRSRWTKLVQLLVCPGVNL